MSYKFTYPIVGSRQYPTRKPMSRWVFPVGIICVAALAFTLYYGSFHWLLPGDMAVTEAALRDMIENLSNGEAFQDAITVFCKEIIAGAG